MAEVIKRNPKAPEPTAASYGRAVYNFIGLYRYFGYSLGILLMAVWPRVYGATPEERVYLALGITGILTLYKIIWPHYDPGGINPVFLAGAETVLVLTLILWTGGLNSGLLLYSLAPVIATALIYGMKLPMGLALLAGAAILSGHLLLLPWFSNLAWLLAGSHLVFFILYVTALLLAAAIPQRVNLSLRQRLQGEAVAEERRKMSWEMHDGLAQSLAYLRLQNRLAVEKLSARDSQGALTILKDTGHVIQEAYIEVRESIDLLRLKREGSSLPATLPTYVQEFTARCGLKAEVDLPAQRWSLPPLLELQIMGILQGVLSNIRKHAQATTVRVRLSFQNGSLELAIEDDGRGFDPQLAQKGEAGGVGFSRHGLAIMQERAASIGGALFINSVPGRGSQVKLVVPLKERG